MTGCRLLATVLMLAAPTLVAGQDFGSLDLGSSAPVVSDQALLADARIQLLEQSAHGGNLNAMVELGEHYAEGSLDHHNQRKAFTLFARAAERDHPAGQYNLAMQYYWGLGVPRDPALAYQWYQRAADQGHPKAQHNLAHMYLRGIDIQRNVPEAVHWFSRAAEQGLPESKSGLGVLLTSGEGGVTDYKRAFSLYRESAGEGNSRGQHNLAVMYYRGTGVRQHLGYAYFWAVMAARQGRPESIRLARMLEGKIPERNSTQIRRQAIAWHNSNRVALNGVELNRWFAGLAVESFAK